MKTLPKIALTAIVALALGTSAHASQALGHGTYECKYGEQTEFYHIWTNEGILQTQIVAVPGQSRADDLIIYGKWKQISKTKIKLYNHDTGNKFFDAGEMVKTKNGFMRKSNDESGNYKCRKVK